MTTSTFASICTVGLLALAPAIASADQITLTSADNTVRFTGEFAGFDQDKYLIYVKGHMIALPIMMMNCEGSDCLGFSPLPERANADS